MFAVGICNQLGGPRDYGDHLDDSKLLFLLSPEAVLLRRMRPRVERLLCVEAREAPDSLGWAGLGGR